MLLTVFCGEAQSKSISEDSVITIAGEEYDHSGFYKLLWGENRRKEWTTKVKVPIVYLDSINGGLVPYKIGGGNESKSLRLHSPGGKQYSLRSVNKSRKAVTPSLLRHTFVGKVIQDGVSMSYPYASLAVPFMMTAANIYHTQPKLVYIPMQAALDSFNDVFAEDLYFLEERPDGDWSDADYLGNAAKFYSTTEMLEKTRENAGYHINQFAYIKGRLFDILINDWDRNHDNVKWGTRSNDSSTFFPIFRDRDQAFFSRNGILLKAMVPLTRVGFMQNFGYHVKNVAKLTKQDRKVDQLLANAMAMDDWIKAARELQSALTDSVIAASVEKLPPEIFKISGKEIIDKIRSRLKDLHIYAADFYRTLAKNIIITGTTGKDYIKVSQPSAGNYVIEIFKVTGDKTDNHPYYHRAISGQETTSLAIYGLGSNDIFDISPAIKGLKISTRSAEEIPKLQ